MDVFRSWLATIRYCIRSAPGGGEQGALDHTKDYHTDAPELPPRHTPGKEKRLFESAWCHFGVENLFL